MPSALFESFLTLNEMVIIICNSLTIGSMDRIGKCSDNSTCLGLRAPTICTCCKKLRCVQSIIERFYSVNGKIPHPVYFKDIMGCERVRPCI